MANLIIPNKLFFRIGEVCKLLSLEPYVLRFWETEFPTLAPTKGSNGRRMYRKKDVEMVVAIKNLLYGQGFTIAGAKKVLAGKVSPKTLSEFSPQKNRDEEKGEPPDGQPSALSREKVIRLKAELREILTILNRRC
jgi:DNA-binding transcriptional MerR regulator